MLGPLIEGLGGPCIRQSMDLPGLHPPCTRHDRGGGGDCFDKNTFKKAKTGVGPVDPPVGRLTPRSSNAGSAKEDSVSCNTT